MPNSSYFRGAKAFSLLIAIGISLHGPAFAARFVDTSKSWTENYVNRLSDKGIIGAEPDGKFNPDQPVSRAQFAAWLVKVLGLENQQTPAASSYADVKTTDWFFKSVEIARQNNIMSGYADGFRPNAHIQRAEMLALVARLLRTAAPDQAQVNTELAKFKDASAVPEWAKTAVVQDVLAGVYVNEAAPDELKPTADATRGECAAILGKLDEYLGKQAVDAALTTPVAPQGLPEPNYNTAYTPPSGGYSPPYGQPPAGYQPPQIAGQVAKNGQTLNYAPPGQGQYAPPYGAPPGYLQGGVSTVAAGTKFRAQLRTTIDSATARAGEQVEATINDPIYVNGAPVVPAGTRLIGSITDAVSAKRFRAGANGKVDIRFTSMETPDGRRFPLSASVDGIRLSGGTAAGRVGKTAAATAIGAGGGALLGTAIGAIVGGAGGGRSVGQAIGIGALMGTAIGGAGGAVTGVVRKGSEVHLNAGMSLPLQLDSQLQMTAAQQPPPYGY